MELIDRRLNYLLIVRSFMRSDIIQFSFTFARTQTSKYCHSSRHNSYADKPDPSVWISWTRFETVYGGLFNSFGIAFLSALLCSRPDSHSNVGHVRSETCDEQRQNFSLSTTTRFDLLPPEEYSPSRFETSKSFNQPKSKSHRHNIS